MERRRFLKGLIFTSFASAISLKPQSLFSNTPKVTQKDNDLVAVIGGEPAQLYKTAIAAMGGIGRFVKRGQKVVVKPNIGWDKKPEFNANTNPQLVVEIIKDCLKAGASEVSVFDHTCDEWQSCYKNSGIEDAVKSAGGKILFAHDQKYYRSVNLPKGIRLKDVQIHEAILDCDVWINVPVLKNHGGAKMTLAMKNFMGIVWDRRFWHANDLQQCIADCATYSKKPILNILDGYRVMTQNGPKGKSLDDVQMGRAIFMSTDMVAIDTAATKFFNQFKPMTIDDASHIKLAENSGVGTTNLDSIKVERIKL